MTRHLIAQQDDLKDGEMKQVSVGETDVLLVCTEGQVTALQATCPHNGAPLAKGVLNGSRLVCPWHHACFTAHGELLEPPALDSLARFEISRDGDALFIELPEGDIPENPLPELATPDEADSRTFVIVGAGAAGTTAAQTLREDGFGGRVLLISQEDTQPYDRTLLSKGVLAGEADSKPLRDAAFYGAHGVELFTQTVKQLDPKAQQLGFTDGDTQHYDALLLATGSTPKPLGVPGSDLDGVFYLRTLQDSQTLAAAAQEGARAIVIGASFIGLECASSLSERGLNVTVVTPDETPFAGLFGSEVGEMFQKLHEKNGVVFVSEAKVTRLSGEVQVTHAVLEDGQELPADLVVVGVGVAPAVPEITDFTPNEDGSVSVDRFLQLTGDYGPVYAAGDLAYYPDAFSGEAIRVEHWRLAMQHGRAAAHNMVGQEGAFTGVPFFWTKQHGLNVRYVGHASGWDEVVVDGDLGAHEFLAYYLKEGQLQAVLGVQKDPELAAAEECFRLGTLPPVEDMRARKVDWLGQLEPNL